MRNEVKVYSIFEPDEAFIETAFCPTCKITKLIECFAWDTSAATIPCRRSECKECHAHHAKVRARLRKLFPNVPVVCDACGCIPKRGGKLVLDHDHITEEFRGYICETCNRGFSAFGDNVAGMEKGIVYLKRPKPKSEGYFDG